MMDFLSKCQMKNKMSENMKGFFSFLLELLAKTKQKPTNHWDKCKVLLCNLYNTLECLCSNRAVPWWTHKDPNELRKCPKEWPWRKWLILLKEFYCSNICCIRNAQQWCRRMDTDLFTESSSRREQNQVHVVILHVAQASQRINVKS